ncbi:MAG: PilZ domain-containing protein [Deltaproteobacteria bacterium]|jgi:c-di-GMP-binding flagellar brake protein YcgR|nr:PilZ domain-containing protein [Deltaproteobacteria bacterium]
MNSKSIEFQKIKENTKSTEITRNIFRIPTEDMEDIFLVIRGTKYKVVDISQGGVGIGLEDNFVFTTGETVENCELHIFKHLLKNLKIRIIHFRTKASKISHCGIQWVDIDKQSSDQLSKIILKMKDQLLK